MPDDRIRILDQDFKAFDMAPRLWTIRMIFPANWDEGATMSVEQVLLLSLANGMSISKLILNN